MLHRMSMMFHRALLLMLIVVSYPVGASVIHRGLGPEPDSLDIHQAQGVAALNVLRDTGEGLLKPGPAAEPVPGVARDYSVSDDGLTWRFELRDDARWSDGSPVVAQDFVRGWQRAMNPLTASPTANLLDAVSNALAVRRGEAPISSLGIKAEGNNVVISLQRRAPWLPYLLMHPVTFPLPDSAEYDPREGPNNGAYMLTDWRPNDHLALESNPHYWSRNSVSIDSVRYYPIEDPSAELNRYRAGELHITETIPPGRYSWLVDNHGAELNVSPYLGSFFLGLNLTREPLAGQRDLRRALSLAVDRDKLTRLVLASGEKPAYTLTPPGIGNYVPPIPAYAAMSQAERDAEAKRLYASLGYSKRKPLRIELRFNTSTTHRRMGVAVAAMWKQTLGVQTQLINEEWRVFVNNRRQRVVTEVFRGGWIADYPDPISFLGLMAADHDQNWGGYAGEKYREHILMASERQGDERLKWLSRAEQRLLDDQAVIPLYYYVSRHLVRDNIAGFIDNVQDVHLSQYLQLRDNRQP